MTCYLAAATLLCVVAMVVARVLQLRWAGTQAMHLGNLDRTDFLIPVVASFYFYTVLGSAFGWPLLGGARLFASGVVAWVGVAVGFCGLAAFLATLVSFGSSFRVGIDVDRPDALVTTGVFAFSRNPIFVGAMMILLGQLLVFPNWVTALYFVGGAAIIHRQVVREEDFLGEHYGEAYARYCERVRRYV